MQLQTPLCGEGVGFCRMDTIPQGFCLKKVKDRWGLAQQQWLLPFKNLFINMSQLSALQIPTVCDF